MDVLEQCASARKILAVLAAEGSELSAKEIHQRKGLNNRERHVIETWLMALEGEGLVSKSKEDEDDEDSRTLYMITYSCEDVAGELIDWHIEQKRRTKKQKREDRRKELERLAEYEDMTGDEEESE